MSLFSTRVRYALRLMVEVHRGSRTDSPISLNSVGKRTGISQGYLEELVRPLKAAGLLRGRKGRQGGYQLARPASQITVCDVIEAAIGPVCVADCVTDPGQCERADYCECRLLFRLLSLQLRTSLQALTLVDMSDVRKLDQVRRDLVELSEVSQPQRAVAGSAESLRVRA